jgi:hypothetical protein
VVPPAKVLVASFGISSSDPKHGWLPADSNDPWGRGPAFMGIDNELHSSLIAETRVFMSGLSDEAGAAQPLAMAMKQLGMPVVSEIDKIEQYVHETLLQKEGQQDGKFIQVRVRGSHRVSYGFKYQSAYSCSAPVSEHE